ncbi:PepSY-associated TM helix domain-containing protein [Pseudomonas sp. UBA2684]|uniref:PepSY-associated TM helix domain-containing protein n=1 Tax=Pseudomonas sp. UBA2684 TaxID=1947311 RepID=UPI000E96E1B7|nr:PepSY domain-containing protein [Pseudomonas sp. UBA2684]HBX56257.1 peptidase [Pseudomonas sp.]|tara:strand:- start:27541 stop:28914 length:1374 start_codon:yes stop_codon:yes gene_type:complete
MNKRAPSFYNLAWRWHFYAGLFVIPFLILLSLTGIIYLFKPQLDQLMYPELLQVPVAAQPISADQQLAVVRQAYPQALIKQYLPPINAERSAQFVIEAEGQGLNVFVDPYRGTLLGSQDAQNNLQAIARQLHGELMIGTVGDRLIELAAGWGIVLVVSGLYLWWPRGSSGAGVLWPRLSARGRLLWRDLHAVTGFWGSLLLLFMLLTGMTWTGFWGAQFAGAWNHFPAAMWDAVPQSGKLTGSLNNSSQQTVAWAVETTPLPASDPHAAHNGHAASSAPSTVAQVSLQQVVDSAAARGVQPGYSITMPKGETGVYSVALFADDPRNDATLHLDQYSGAVLADVRWQDYGPVAKTVETGVMLHEGKLFGLANQLLMLAVCLLVLLSAVSGLIMWWTRRPQGSLGVPPLRHDLPRWKSAIVIMLLLGAAFPLVGASLLLIWALDWLLLSRLSGQRLANG